MNIINQDHIFIAINDCGTKKTNDGLFLMKRNFKWKVMKEMREEK